MTRSNVDSRIACFLKAGVALLPLIVAGLTVPAHAQTPTASTSPGQQPASSETAPKDAADAESQEASEADTKVVGAPAREGDKKDEESVVVTGTSIRNAPPTGTNLISIDKEGIKASGANSGAELIANIPQAGGGQFNDIPGPAGGDTGGFGVTGGAIERPNLRALPVGGTDTGAGTLILLDGQRSAGTGMRTNATDVNGLPVALLERLEVNTDGGSSVYGADALGGVINFVTRRRFDGVQLRGRYGIADDHHIYEFGGIAGHTFGPVSAYISYSRSGNDMLLNGERDFFRSIDWNTGLEIGLQCTESNVGVSGGRFYGVDANGNISSTPGTATSPVTAGGIQSPNLCTPEEFATLQGSNTRNNVLGNVAYDITEDIKFTVRGRYSDSKNRTLRVPFGASLQIRPTNFYYQDLPGEPGQETQTVQLSFLDAFGPEFQEAIFNSKQYGVSPELTANIDGNWQVRAFVNWEIGETFRRSNELNATALQAAAAGGTADTALNPYNPEASNPAVLNLISDFEDTAESRDKILNARVTLDGSLFELPGGKVRVALGGEYLKDTYRIRSFRGVESGSGLEAQDYAQASRNSKSLFAEVNVPIVSSLNSGPLFEELRLAFSGRYDDFSDFGDTFNPRIGATYSPFKWLRFRGNWGTSFRAPTIVDTLAGATSRINIFPLASFASIAEDPNRPIRPGDLATGLFIAYQGARPDLKPQTGTNWSVAGEIRPIDGLRAELSYYKIDYRGILGSINPFDVQAWRGALNVYPSDAEIAAFFAGAPNASDISLIGGRPVYGIIDIRTTNLGTAKIEGLDYSARYDFSTPIGDAYVSANGTINLVNKTRASTTQPFSSTLNFQPNHRTSINVGLRSGGFRTQWTLNHTDGFKVNRTATLLQDSVGSYDLVNAFFAYRFEAGELGLGDFTDGLELTLNVQNVFDDAPPLFRSRGGTGYTNGGTVGRLIQLGATIDF